MNIAQMFQTAGTVDGNARANGDFVEKGQGRCSRGVPISCCKPRANGPATERVWGPSESQELLMRSLATLLAAVFTLAFACVDSAEAYRAVRRGAVIGPHGAAGRTTVCGPNGCARRATACGPNGCVRRGGAVRF
jgi:hypothetical protein